MEPIRDLSWMMQAASGALEKFELNGWAVVAVGLSTPDEGAGRGYRFRMFFSPPADRRPVLAINLERSLLGEWLVTEQEGPDRRVLERLDGPLHYDGFRIKALERALEKLGRAAPAKSASARKKTLKSRRPPADT